MIIVRAENSEDRQAIHQVVELAFGRPNEADLVDALRENASPCLSLVALVEEQIVGHIFFSPATVESDNGIFAAIGVAPLAVLPEYQNQGVGSRLVREGLKECRRFGHDIVVVLGHSKYYPRFGFGAASLKGLRSEYDVPDDVFMVTELKPDALGGRQGVVKYHREFGKV